MKHFFLQQLSFLLEEQQTGISPTASLKIRSINGFSNSTINDSTIISPCSMPVCVLVLKSLFDTGPVFSVSDVPLSVSINSTWVFGQSQKQFRQLRLVKFKARDSMKLWKWLLPWTWHIWMLCTVLGSPVQDRHGYTAVSLAEATKLVRGWSTSCRKRSWRSSFCSAWRRVGSGSHIAVYSYLMGSWRNGNSDGGERKKKKKKNHSNCDQTWEQTVKINKRNSIFGDLQNTSEQDLKQPALTSKLALLWAGELNQRPPEVPSHLHYSVFHYHFFNLRFNSLSIMGCLSTPSQVCWSYWLLSYCILQLCDHDQSTNEASQSGKRMLFPFPEAIFTKIKSAPNCSLLVLPVWSAVCPAIAEHQVPPLIQLCTLPVVPSARQLLPGQTQLLYAGADSVHLPNYRDSKG